MEVLDANLTPLSAFETFELIRDLKVTQDRLYADFELAVSDPTSVQTFSHSDREHLNPDNLQQLMNPLIAHFESPNLPQTRQTSRAILCLLDQLRNKFGQAGGREKGLTKAERLQICDLAPTEVVEIYLIVEECDSRFTEEEIEEILALVKISLSSDRLLTSSTAPNPHTTAKKHQAQDHLNGIDQFEYDQDFEMNLGDIDDDDALVAEAREGGVPADQELDEVPD